MADSAFFHNAGSLSLNDIAALTGAVAMSRNEKALDGARLFRDVAPLDRAQPDEISFLDNAKYISQFESSKAGACFVRKKLAERAPAGMVLLVTEEPYGAYALTAQRFYPQPAFVPVISPNALIAASSVLGEGVRVDAGAVIGEGVRIGHGSWIGANCVIGDHVEIGEQCRIGATCTLSHARLGQRVILHRGVQIGQDGFGFAATPRGAVKVPQLGRVLIHDDVEIGSNSCIDRGSGPDTVIGAGSKIDNLVQIGHNVQIGRSVMIAAQCGISGSTIIDDGVMLGGQVGISGHVRLFAGARAAAQAGIMTDIPKGATYGGSPAQPIRDWHRQTVALAHLSQKPKSMSMNKVLSMPHENTADEVISIERIMEMIPHRYPFLMIDKIIKMVPNDYAIGVKNVSINEQHFQGHFPGKPVMPGVLLIEAMAQTSAVLVVQTLGKGAEGKLVYFMSIDEARFRKPVVPGDCVQIHVIKQQSRRNVWKLACTAKVEGVTVAEAVICAMIVD